MASPHRMTSCTLSKGVSLPLEHIKPYYRQKMQARVASSEVTPSGLRYHSLLKVQCNNGSDKRRKYCKLPIYTWLVESCEGVYS